MGVGVGGVCETCRVKQRERQRVYLVCVCVWIGNLGQREEKTNPETTDQWTQVLIYRVI